MNKAPRFKGSCVVKWAELQDAALDGSGVLCYAIHVLRCFCMGASSWMIS